MNIYDYNYVVSHSLYTPQTLLHKNDHKTDMPCLARFRSVAQQNVS